MPEVNDWPEESPEPDTRHTFNVPLAPAGTFSAEALGIATGGIAGVVGVSVEHATTTSVTPSDAMERACIRVIQLRIPESCEESVRGRTSHPHAPRVDVR